METGCAVPIPTADKTARPCRESVVLVDSHGVESRLFGPHEPSNRTIYRISTSFTGPELTMDPPRETNPRPAQPRLLLSLNVHDDAPVLGSSLLTVRRIVRGESLTDVRGEVYNLCLRSTPDPSTLSVTVAGSLTQNMAEQSMSTYTPLEVALPPSPNPSFFSDAQWTILFALCDAVVPSIRTATTVQSSLDKVISSGEWDTAVSKLTPLIPGPDAAKIATRYLEEDVSSNAVFRSYVQRILGDYVHEEGKAGFGLVMNALKYEYVFHVLRS